MISSRFGNIWGGGSSIPANITAMQGQVIGPPLGEIEIVAGDFLYLKIERLEAGDGVISGPVSISGYVVSVTDGVNIATITIVGFTAVGDTVVLVIETATDGVNSFMRVREVSNG